MDVVLNSHIALLVLGYLYEEKLDNVSKFFCKYSPHLDEEYQIIKKGLRPVVINSDNLSTIVREHCYIKSKVNELISIFPNNISAAFDRQTICGKINHLLKIVRKTMGTSEDGNKLKRTRSEAMSSSDKSNSSTNTTQVEDLPGYCPQKRRRLADSYMFVSNEFSEDSESDEDNETNVQSACVDRILEDKNFQTKLLQNINKVLKNKYSGRNIKPNQSVIDSMLPDKTNNYDQMNQNIVSETEKDSTFDEIVHDVMANSCEIAKKVPNRAEKTTDKLGQIASDAFNELSASQSTKLGSTQPEITSQLGVTVNANNPNLTGLEKSKNSNVFKILSENETSSTELMSDTDKNFSASKFFVMNSTDFVSANIQSFTPFKNEQFFLDLNGMQTFPILMGNDGAMYINSIGIQNDNEPNITLIDNPTQRNLENLNIVLNTSDSEVLGNIPLNTKDVDNETLKENITTNKKSSLSTDITIVDNNSSKSLSSLECKILKDKKTPECNVNALNISISKSLSTPRRRNSHVRVLNFSPLKNFQILNKKPGKQNLLINDRFSEKLDSNPQLNVESNAVVISNNAIENESSNSIDVVDDQSNVTVIQCKIPMNDDTPKRKTSVVSCKRNISRSNSEETAEKNLVKKCGVIVIKEKNSKRITALKKNTKSKKEKTIIQNVIKRRTRQTKDEQKSLEKKNNLESSEIADPMEEWKQLREKSKNPNFDQVLREIHSKTPLADAHIHKRRKLRRKIGSKAKKIKEENDCADKSIEDIKNVEVLVNTSVENKLEHDSNEKSKMAKRNLHEKKSKNVEPKTSFLNFRIKTPIKNNLSHSNKKRYKPKNNKNIMYDTESQPIYIETSTDPHNQVGKEFLDCTNNEDLYENVNFESQQLNISKEKSNNGLRDDECDEMCDSQKLNKEKEKRTANIAHILDTPFKLDENNLIPPTPGFMFTNNLSTDNIITPMTKLASSTFCNLKNTDIKTPSFAITPGGHLTYSTDKETPKSGIVTDYSSGGSYYRPDDSADLNKKLDREINEKFDQRRLKLDKIDQKTALESKICYGKDELLNSLHPVSDIQNKSSDAIVAEIIPCPVVLEKVKSFSKQSPHIVPHYKFIEAGLPDITDESTTSSSSEESSSNSSKSSSPEKISVATGACLEQEVQPLSLLSNIDSSEDEDWEVHSTSKKKVLIGENSQLVSNDGEVRFPVRSWITPKKDEKKSEEKTVVYRSVSKNGNEISNTSTFSTGEEASVKKIELNEKLKRVKEKLNRDTELEINKLSSKRNMKNIGKIDADSNLKKELYEKNSRKTRLYEKKLDVLAALNLSAKKKDVVPVEPFNPNSEVQILDGKNLSSQADDNATSELFTLQMEEESVSNDSMEVRNAALTLTKMKTKGREINPPKSVSIREKEQQFKTIEHKKPMKTKTSSQKSGRARSVVKSHKHEIKDIKPIKSKQVEKNYDSCKSKQNNKSNIKEPDSKESERKIETNVQSTNVTQTTQNLESTSSHLHESNCIITESEVSNNVANNLQNEMEKISTHLSMSESSESEIGDPYNECEPIFSEQTDKHVKHIIFNDDTPISPKSHQQIDLSKLALKFKINDQIREINYSEEFRLFHLEPDIGKNKNLKKISNKKKTKSNKLQKEEDAINKPMVENKKATIIDNMKEPLDSSTPFLRKIKITHRNKFSNEQEVARNKLSPENKNKQSLEERSDLEIDKKFASDLSHIDSTRTLGQEPSKKNIRNEDINAVLSHLYGNGKK